MKKEFIVSYATGAGGTWISWLINQHNNFPKILLEEDNAFYDKTSSDQIGTFHFGVAGRRPLDLESSEDFLNIFLQKNPDAVSNFTKYSYKPSPHAPASIMDYLESKNTHIFNNNTSLVIVGMFSNTDVFVKRNDYINSLFDIYNLHKTGKDYINHNNQCCVKLLDICNEQDIQAEIFDAGKLLFGDVTEYHKLCNYINEPPLDAYPAHVASAIKIVWNKFL